MNTLRMLAPGFKNLQAFCKTVLNLMINLIKRNSALFSPDALVPIPYSTGDSHIYLCTIRQMQQSFKSAVSLQNPL